MTDDILIFLKFVKSLNIILFLRTSITSGWFRCVARTSLELLDNLPKRRKFIGTTSTPICWKIMEVVFLLSALDCEANSGILNKIILLLLEYLLGISARACSWLRDDEFVQPVSSWATSDSNLLNLVFSETLFARITLNCLAMLWTLPSISVNSCQVICC